MTSQLIGLIVLAMLQEEDLFGKLNDAVDIYIYAGYFLIGLLILVIILYAVNKSFEIRNNARGGRKKK